MLFAALTVVAAELEDIDQAVAALMQTINTDQISSDRPMLAEVKTERVRSSDEELLRRFMLADARKTQDSAELRVYEDKDRTLQVFADGAFIFSYPADPKEVTSKKTTLGEARAVAEAFLEQNGGLPEGAYEFKVGHVSQGTSEGEAVVFYFIYSHKISGIPVDSDLVTVAVGAGRVLEYSFRWSQAVQKKGEAAQKPQQVIPAIIAVRQALAFQFERVLGGKLHRPVRVEAATLVYAPRNPKDYAVLTPAWKVTLSMRAQVVTETGSVVTSERPNYFQHILVNALTGDVIVQ
jgi:hypothetical protein